tara:strand:+ start:19074 stop:26462 length:7389 start_codon:yes stop_codon:yes gene_type:complete
MAQKINLNASPYYDDFDSEKNFHKVLYKPGFPVQARELTQQQSILQNQVEKFGDHVFKDGSVVIPGAVGFNIQNNAVKLNNTNFNTDISVYIKNFIGKRIKGSESGIEAVVKSVSLPDGGQVSDITLYVNYLSAGSDSQFSSFTDGESLSSNENIVYGNTTITANTPFASLISVDATAVGSAAFISKGVYFIRGFFVNVSDQSIILDHYTNTPSYRIGLQIEELIVNAKEDNSLFDNAKGFSNFAAPGADRLKIKLILTKKALTDKNDTDFIEVLRLDEGKLKIIETKSDYNKIRDWIAGRTYDESGDYSVEPFNMGLFNSLNDKLGNNGLFFEDEKTEQENTPSDDLMCLKVSAGEVYVRGYDIEKTGTTIIDVDKPRDVGIRSDIGVGFEMGNILKLNNVTKGTAVQGSIVKLFDNFNSTGTNIGSARVYSFNLEDSAYEDVTTKWELRLFDAQTNTDLVLNQSVSNTELPEGSFIKGKNSGASGFAVGAGGGSTVVSLNETSGSFNVGEQIQINGVDFPRTIGIKTEYAAQNIRSIGDGNNLKGDVVIEKFNLPNAITEVSVTAGIATASLSQGFKGLRKGSLVVYRKAGSTLDTFNTVSSINANGTITLALIPDSVAGVYDGSLTSGTEVVNMFLGAPVIRGTGALYVPLNPNIADVDLTESKIKITKQISKNASSNQLTINTSDITDVSDVIFDTFDQERYTMSTASNGSPLAITNDTFSYGTDGASVTFTNIAANDSKTVNVSLIKNKVKSKIKQYNRSQTLNVTRSKNAESGSVAGGNGGSIADGLTFDARYGLRVQDEEISLNYPDVAKFLAVYESTNASAPVLDKLTFTSTVAVQDNAIIGENIISQDSNIIARVVSSPSANTLEIVYLTSGKFQTGELVHFEESDINTNIESITIGKYKNVTNSFTLDKGQKDEFYDYSRLIRNRNVSEPSAQLLVVFDYYSVSSDDGDVFTVRSYDEERFSKDIPDIGEFNIRATDTLDFRPRVSVYNPATDTGSPFEFSTRDFSGTSILHYFTPNESSTASYSFYLGRQDTVYMNKFGEFVYEKGVSSLDPKPPTMVGELMELATISLPPYLYNPQDATLTLIDNRRFTMRDIGNIEDRVTNLEETTTLSLLEVSAQTLQIQDEEGKNRFKSGLFADPFKNYNFISEDSLIQINPESEELIPFRTRDTLASQIKPAEITISSQLDFNTDFPLFDTNVKKTGNVVTLNYEEVEWITQPYATISGDTNDIINVNPYELPIFEGEVELDPAFDRWTRSTQLADHNIQQTGTTRNEIINLGEVRRQFLMGGGIRRDLSRFGLGTNERVQLGQTIVRSNTTVTRQNNLTSTSNDDFVRSRNIQFISEGFVDFVETYVFFDGQKIFDVIPKLLEITPTKNGSVSGSNGVYKIGEEVHALNEEGNVIMKFRLCQPDHKSGKYNNPSETYFNNPYTSGITEISSNYSQSSTVLNVDTKSLAEEAQGKYFGYVTKNAQLVGQESGATSYVKDIRLITDAYGDVLGSCFIRNPHTQPAPPVKIQTGVKEFKVTTSPTNENVEPTQKFGVITAEEQYDSRGTVEEWQTTVTTTTNTTNFLIRGTIRRRRRNVDPLAQTFIVGGNVNAPSAQDANKDKNGAFITAVEVYFATVDTVTNSPIRCEIRTTIADARPSMEVIGRSRTLKPKGTDANGNEVTLIEADPNEASKATKFTFPEPIYLEPGTSYSFVLLAPRSVAYNVWTGRHGGTAVNPSTITGANPGSSIIYSTQYGAGSIFKSQNGALWTEDQHQDMTFKLYKAKFTSQSGSAFFNNPDLDESNGYETSMIDNPLFTLSKTGSIGITTNLGMGSFLTPGRKICGGQNTSTAVITGVGCSVSTLTALPNIGGSNYTTDSDVETFAITGKGSGLKIDIDTIDSNGAITAVNTTPVVRGTGYQVGDVVGIVTSTVGTKGGQGEGAQITIGSIDGIDTLFLTNIQADNGSNGFQDGTQIKYFNDAGTVVAMGATGAIRSSGVAFDGGAHAGNVLFVEQFNHGMYSTSNKVKIRQIESDVEPTIITADLSKTETSIISVASTSQFTNFEGIAVGAANTGYVKVGSEIIGYESVGTGVLNIGNSQRGVDNTVVIDHSLNSVIKKHEIAGVSIRRLETTDTTGLSVVDYPRQPIDLDTYHVTFDRSKNGTNRSTDTATSPQLSFTHDEFVGGSNVRATQNILYSAIVPRYDVLTPTGVEGAVTGIQASIRSVSGTSASGNEVSYLDDGFQNVQLNTINTFDKVKLVASKINENQNLIGLPSNKSFTTVLNLNSNDENLSPMIHLTSGSETEFIGNRLDRPVNLENYDSDGRVNSVIDDPHSAIYMSNRVNLKNPATSLKVLLSAFRPESSDFRVLYSLVRPDSNEVEQSFELFPGFKNTTKTNNDGFIVDDESKNDGRPDTIVTPSLDNQFKEYQFTVDNLPEFIGFTIKIVMSGTNQAQPPRIKELRAIAVK